MKKLLTSISMIVVLIFALSVLPIAVEAADIAITGTLKPGYTLKVNYDGNGTLTWYRRDSNGVDTLITNVTGNSYTLVNADGNHKIKVVVQEAGGTESSFITGDIAAPLGPIGDRHSNILSEYGNANYQFALEETGEKFILLDTSNDDTGKFFVLSYKAYGSYQFDFSGSQPSATQKFDPSYNKDIAYWLNNDFKISGNGIAMSPIIFDYIDNNHEWLTEAGTADGNCPNDYVVKCGLAFLSYTEFYRYKDKFGWRDGTSASWWLRTGRSTGKNHVWMCNHYEKGTHNDVAYSSLQVRPAFYLSKDFFKDVRINLLTAGDEVIKALKGIYTADELMNVYSEAELHTHFGLNEYNILSLDYEDGDGNALTDLTSVGKIKETAVFSSLSLGTTVYMVSILYDVDGAMKKVAMAKGKSVVGVGLVLVCNMDLTGVTVKEGDYLSTIFWKDMMGIYPLTDVYTFVNQ